MRLFVNNLTNIDFSYLDATRGLVGETWLASIELQGSLDDQGMVCDFGIVKKKLRHWLDDILDHRLLIPKDADNLQLQNSNAHCHFTWQLADGHITSECPADALTFIEAKSITIDSVAQWCQLKLANEFPQTVENLSVRFTCESIDTPYYHYSHGLKKHNGNCQRIAHGHRSRLNIWIDDQICPGEIQRWAKRWQDIYIGSKEDLCQNHTAEHTAFQYTAQQGNFYLELPSRNCYVIDSDSTVELIAHHIAAQLKHEYPQQRVKVQAFEGLAKGAIVELE